jgi:hypothetical protein
MRDTGVQALLSLEQVRGRFGAAGKTLQEELRRATSPTQLIVFE